MDKNLISFIENNEQIESYLKELNALNIILSNDQFKWLALAELVSADNNTTKEEIKISLNRIKFIKKNIDLLQLKDSKDIKKYVLEIQRTLKRDLQKFVKSRKKKKTKKFKKK